MTSTAHSTAADSTAGSVADEVRVRELGHIVLYVADLERSLAFYRDVLRWPVRSRPQRFPAAGFRAGNTHHDLLLIEVGADAAPLPPGRRLGLYHFGVKVGDSDDELRAMKARVEAHPEVCTLVGQSDHGITHSLYVHDPDGNEIELYIDVPGVDWDDPAVTGRPTQPLDL